ncbi:MAG: multiubiquitin domain-containing protein [Lachnospiraceae bacterium]|nr:multiubiquitin domain-containing protein [Lachnospiraceae bacterium]
MSENNLVNAKTITIIVNGVRKEVRKQNISFEEIVRLAFGQYHADDNIAYTVTYSYKNGHDHNKGITGCRRFCKT